MTFYEWVAVAVLALGFVTTLGVVISLILIFTEVDS